MPWHACQHAIPSANRSLAMAQNLVNGRFDFYNQKLTTARLESFSDGVFAVAITLLALDVRLPALPAPVAESALTEALLALGPKLFTYIMTFILVGMFWIAHHRIFRSVARVDRWLLWINTVLLLFICLLPLSAATYSTYFDYPAAITVYGVNVILVGQAMFALWHYAVKRRLLTPGTPRELIRIAYWRIVLGTPVYLIGIAVAYITPRLSAVVYVIALAMYIAPSPIDRHYQQTHPETND